MDSDEEEMKNLRSTAQYGARAPQRQKQDDADDDEDAQQDQAAKPRRALGPRPPGADKSDSDENMSVDGEDAFGPSAMSSFLPMSFGKKVISQKPKPEVHEQMKRPQKGGSRRGVALDSNGLVQMGPSRPAASSSNAGKSAVEAELPKAPLPAVPEDKAVPMDEDDEDDGQGKDSLPLSHEVSIPANERAVTAFGVDPKAARMVVGGMDGNCRFFDFGGMNEKKEAFRMVEPVDGHMVQAISFSTSGGAVLVVCSDAHARIYDRDGSAKLIQSTVKGDMYVRDVLHTKGHTQTLTDGMWHPYSAHNWITSSLDGTVRIWDLNATPVGMDQVLPSIHVLKCVDKRNVCVGGGSGRAGGLHPTCCAMSSLDGMIAGGCSDGSVQVFFSKDRYQRADRILRQSHTGQVTSVDFLQQCSHGRLLATRSMDGTMKLWDCRMLSDAKGPLRTFGNLPCALEKTGVCGSPDGRFVVTGTSFQKGSAESSTIHVYSTQDFKQEKAIDFGKRSITRLMWPAAMNQVLVGTSSGEVVMLYNPLTSKGGAMHFVGKKAKKKASHEIEDSGTGPIFNMTDPSDIKKFYSTGHGNMTAIRRNEARHNQKTLVPEKPPSQKDGIHTNTSMFVSHVISKDRKKQTEEDMDIQKALLAQDAKVDPNIMKRAYKDSQPQKLLDYSVEESEGDKRMNQAGKGDFCRKCGQKICRCVDYSIYGQAKKPKLT
mmetsp:Transcript_19012/g.44353  ORF Transcript_19012/g.44353 Transcript_19012/m.44353 type:complete len:712 (+) Transcript_19012:103-2238(+)